MAPIPQVPADQAAPSGFELRSYLAVLRARRRLILAIAGAVTAGALIASLGLNALSGPSDRTYRTEVAVHLPPLPVPIAPEAEARLLESPEVAAEVIGDLQLDDSPETVAADLGTTVAGEILVLTYTADRRDLSVEVPTAFATEYIAIRSARAATALRDEVSGLTARVTAVEKRLRGLGTGEAASGSRTALLLELTNLEGQIAAAREEAGNAGEAQVVGTETRTRTGRDGGLSPAKGIAAGVLLGLALGIGSAFAAEFLADRFRTRDEITRISGAPILAIVPIGLAAVEGYRQAREAVQHLATENVLSPVLITSASDREGKTAVAIGLARALAEAEEKVTLVASDLRDRDLDRWFGLSGEGLADAVLGKTPVVDREVDGPGDLRVVTGGDPASDGAVVLASPHFNSVLRSIDEARDITILDSPPVLDSAAALSLARAAKNVILVIDAQHGRRTRTREARDALASVGANVLGCVVTNFDPSRTPLDHATSV